ncbi:hypothetical protein JRA82_005397, partial [Raoultella ornithinolytica]|nr:hypothetical protein [Raoultella ornithinolytica]
MAKIPLPTPTKNPVPSTDIRDHLFAGAKLDEEVNSTTESYLDRFNVSHLTAVGRDNVFRRFINWLTGRGEQAIAAIGWQELGDWAIGLTVQNRNQIVSYNGAWYKYLGELEHVIAGDSPENDGGVWSAENPTGKWSNIGDAALRNDLFTRGKYISWVTPLVFSSLEECFESGAENVLIPAGTYPITKKMRVDITHNLNIVCQPGAVFKLADNVRQNMLVFVGNGTNNFSWKGGEIDGNWEGQGGETLDGNGNIQDVSHGLIVSMFNRAVVTGVHAHDCMGHHINHGGNWFFHAYDIDLKSHPSALKPEEGARGDGITGCSRHILIENIRGFTTDDFVGIFAGINWIEGIGPESGGYRDIDSIVLRNLNPQSLTVDGVTYPAWTGCSIRPCYGKKIPYI